MHIVPSQSPRNLHNVDLAVVGDVVILPGGDRGVVTAAREDEVDVLHTDRALGCGPWTWHRSQVEVCEPFVSAFDCESDMRECEEMGA